MAGALEAAPLTQTPTHTHTHTQHMACHSIPGGQQQDHVLELSELNPISAGKVDGGGGSGGYEGGDVFSVFPISLTFTQSKV